MALVLAGVAKLKMCLVYRQHQGRKASPSARVSKKAYFPLICRTSFSKPKKTHFSFHEAISAKKMPDRTDLQSRQCQVNLGKHDCMTSYNIYLRLISCKNKWGFLEACPE